MLSCLCFPLLWSVPHELIPRIKSFRPHFGNVLHILDPSHCERGGIEWWKLNPFIGGIQRCRSISLFSVKLLQSFMIYDLDPKKKKKGIQLDDTLTLANPSPTTYTCMKLMKNFKDKVRVKFTDFQLNYNSYTNGIFLLYPILPSLIFSGKKIKSSNKVIILFDKKKKNRVISFDPLGKAGVCQRFVHILFILEWRGVLFFFRNHFLPFKS